MGTGRRCSARRDGPQPRDLRAAVHGRRCRASGTSARACSHRRRPPRRTSRPAAPPSGWRLSFAMLRAWGFEAAASRSPLPCRASGTSCSCSARPRSRSRCSRSRVGRTRMLSRRDHRSRGVRRRSSSAFAIASVSARPRALRRRPLPRASLAVGARLIGARPVKWNGESLVAFRGQAIGLLRRRWLDPSPLATLAGQLSVFLVLRRLPAHARRAARRGHARRGVRRLDARAPDLGSLPITPGGVGFVELGLTGALVGFGGPNDAVVAAVLLYRLLTIVPTLALGLIAGALWRRLRPEPALEQGV